MKLMSYGTGKKHGKRSQFFKIETYPCLDNGPFLEKGGESIKSLSRISHLNAIVNAYAIPSRPGGDGPAAEDGCPDFASAMGVFYDDGIQKAGFSYGTSY